MPHKDPAIERSYRRQRYADDLDRFREYGRQKYRRRLPQEKARARRKWLWKKYKLTEADLAKRVAEQDGKCAICHRPTANLHIDHDHARDQVRELLCGSCNRMIGLAGESVEVLARAIEYLGKHKEI